LQRSEISLDTGPPFSVIHRIGAKVKAELEGNAEQVTCMSRFYHQCKLKTVPTPNACKIAFFMMTN